MDLFIDGNFIGHTVEQVDELLAKGYNPSSYYDRDPELAAVIDWLGSGEFTADEPHEILLPISYKALFHKHFL